MEQKYYTVERGQQILISLLKQNGIRKIIASPGTTNVTFVGSVQNDPFFEVYSSVDERSAAYMAVGMAEETGEAVVLSCTGATASRNYIPGLTEAFYRKLPILAVTATQNENHIGHMIPQMMDRTQQLKDMAVHSEHVPVPRDENDEWDATIRLNRAILALRHRGGGPVHINLATNYNKDFSVKELPVAHCIRRYMPWNEFPQLPQGRIGIRVDSHLPWTARQKEAVDRFCAAYGAVVFCEHCSNYDGRYRVNLGIVNQQEMYSKDAFATDLLIHIGEVGGYGNGGCGKTKAVWRVNEDGELRDPMRKLANVFEMREEDFFNRYVEMAEKREEQQAKGKAWLESCRKSYERLHALVPDLPLSNLWIAKQTAHRLPQGSVLHAGILNSLRAWTLFDTPQSVQSQSFVNTGGFGIDGCMSSMVGGSVARPDKLHFLIIGDLAFFYDLNSIGNRHVGNNIRILLVNNGKGTEFRNYNHFAARFGDDADRFMAAAGHYGNKSHQLVRHYAEDLGFEYMQATTKEEYLGHIERFLTPEMTEKPMLLEVFTDNGDESLALKAMNTLVSDSSITVKNSIKKMLPDAMVKVLKEVVKK